MADLIASLVSGITGAMGAEGGALDQKLAAKNADRRATDREYLQAQSHEIFDEVRKLQDAKVKLNPKTDQESITAIDKRLGALQKQFTNLYHPSNNPGALAHLHSFIQEHLGKHKRPVDPSEYGAPNPKYDIPKTPGEAKQQGSWAGSPALGTNQNPDLQFVQQLEGAGLSHEDAITALKVKNGIQGRPGVVKPESPATGEPNTPKPVHQTSDERARADFDAFKKTHPEYKGTYERWKAEQSHLPKSTTPKAPGAPKLTPAQNKAQQQYVTMKALDSLADQALATPSSTSDKNLILEMVRSAAGRVNLQEIEMYRGQAGWANRLVQWAKSADTGQLPDDVRKQLVGTVKQKLKSAKDALDAANELAPKVPATPGAAKQMAKPSASDSSDVDDIIKALKGK